MRDANDARNLRPDCACAGSSKSLIGNGGYRRYVKMEGSRPSIDEDTVKAVEISLDDKRYLARTELVGRADLAFRALGTRPPLRVTELPRRQSDAGEECCGTRDPYAAEPNGDEASQE